MAKSKINPNILWSRQTWLWPLVVLLLALGAFYTKPWQIKPAETISVSASGKTQVTPNIAKITATIESQNPNLDEARSDNEQKISTIVTKLKELGGTNFRMGASKYLVIEACEYDGSFLNYSPKITVITNIDKEHMDYFKTFANVKKTFMDFIVRLPIDGWLVVNRDEKNLKIKNPMPTGRQEKSKIKNVDLLKIVI